MKTREHRETVKHDRVEEQIRHEAFRLWQREGCPEGRELDHWLAAKEIVHHHLHEAVEEQKRRDEEVLLVE
jgi:hypothetical protein